MNNSDNRELAAVRTAKILKILQESRVARVNELSEALGVSAATIRRDLVEMEQNEQLVRVHGGAVCADSQMDEPVFSDKAEIAAPQKQAIAEAALPLIKPNDSIYLDGGSTVLALARLLADMRDLTVVTNSLHVASTFASAGPHTIVIGGELRRLSQTFVGALTQSMLEDLHVDTAFLGTIGLSPEHGLTTTDPREAFTKNLVLSHASRHVLLADSTKLGNVSFTKFGAATDLHMLITDAGAGEPDLHAYRDLGIEVLTAKVD